MNHKEIKARKTRRKMEQKMSIMINIYRGPHVPNFLFQTPSPNVRKADAVPPVGKQPHPWPKTYQSLLQPAAI